MSGRKSQSPSTQEQWAPWDPKGSGRVTQSSKTEASHMGMFYRAANDTKIAIHGKKAVKEYTKEGSDICMDIQIADVKKTLESVGRLCEAGNTVVFDDDGSYVENKRTGEKAMLVKERRSYVLSFWVERGPKQRPFSEAGSAGMSHPSLVRPEEGKERGRLARMDEEDDEETAHQKEANRIGHGGKGGRIGGEPGKGTGTHYGWTR